MAVVINGTTGIDKVQDGSIGTADIAADAITTPKIANSVNLGRRNIVINGAMNVAQRSTSLSGVTSGGYLTTDRFYTDLTSLGTYTVSQSTDAPSGFAHSLKYLCTTADASPASGDTFALQYKMEGQDLQILDYGNSEAKSFTVSFWVKSNKTGTGAFNIRNYDQARGINKSYTINSADTWEYKTIVIDGDTASGISNDSGHGLWLFYIFDSGSGWTSGTANGNWAAWGWSQINALGTLQIGRSVNDYIQITGIQMEVGDTATPFEHRSYGEELTLCHRYFERLTYSNTQFVSIGVANTTTTANTMLSYLPKRASPTITLPAAGTSGGALAFLTSTGGYPSGIGSLSIQLPSATGLARIHGSGFSGLNNGSPSGLFTSGSSSISIDAEI